MAVITRKETGGGKWSETASWEGAKVPTASDDVILNATSGNLEVTGTAKCRSLDATNYKKELKFAAKGEIEIGTSTSNAGLCLKLGAGMTLTFGSECRFLFVSSSKTLEKITLNGIKVPAGGGLWFHGTNGIWEFQDKVEAGFIFVDATKELKLGTQEYILEHFEVNFENTKTINCGKAKVNLNNANSHLEMAQPSFLTFNAEESTFEFTGGALSEKVVEAEGKTFNKLIINSYVRFRTGCTVKKLEFLTAGSAEATKVAEGKTITVTESITTNGKSGSLVKLEGATAGKAWKISKASGVVNLNWLSLKDSTAEGGAEWYAGSGSTDVSGNTGWKFAMALFKEKVTASLTPSGTIKKSFSFTRKLQASLSGVGHLAQSFALKKIIVASLKPEGALTKKLPPIVRILTASLKPEAALGRNILKRLEASVRPEAVLHRTFAFKHFIQATVSPTAALNRVSTIRFQAALQPIGALRRALAVRLKAILTPTARINEVVSQPNENPVTKPESIGRRRRVKTMPIRIRIGR